MKDYDQPDSSPQPEDLSDTGSQSVALLFALEEKAGELAIKWRGTKDKNVVEQYHAVLNCLIALGWQASLDADAGLPEELMPQEYFEHIQRLYREGIKAASAPKNSMKLKIPNDGMVKIGYPADPLLYALQGKVGEFAMKWRGTKDDKVVEQYHAVLKCLIALGWETDLDADAELPDRLMPEEYFAHIKRIYKDVVGEVKGRE